MKRIFNLTTLKRYLTLKTDRIYTLPIIILMPHSGCNCRCVMCDIWRGNDTVQQLNELAVQQLCASLQKLGTEWVVLSGGEALLNPKLFRLCEILQAASVRITLLSTGLLLKRYATEIVQHVDEVIVSLDGSAAVHNAIRRVPTAYEKLQQGIHAIKRESPSFPISARCVIHRYNFCDWPNIIQAAHELALDGISFLPADLSSEAFNRPDVTTSRTQQVQLDPEQLSQLKLTIEALIARFAHDFANGYIAESPQKIYQIYDYYAALHGETDFPAVQCNAPWVSAVVEADGSVRPCFFHHAIGNINHMPLADLLNTPQAHTFRRQLDMAHDETCRKCVCSLNLRPTVSL